MKKNKAEYYWFNEVNMIEVDGPFKTLEAATRHAEVAMKSVGGEDAEIVICQPVKRGTVSHKYKIRWEK